VHDYRSASSDFRGIDFPLSVGYMQINSHEPLASWTIGGINARSLIQLSGRSAQ
jgi:hypothetical protein